MMRGNAQWVVMIRARRPQGKARIVIRAEAGIQAVEDRPAFAWAGGRGSVRFETGCAVAVSRACRLEYSP